ncbi:MAG: hypothetical protein KJ771_02020 [Nanoarchaeota archaeon]|nr:hypothetical protein [Nanoarchaeota archaeon]
MNDTTPEIQYRIDEIYKNKSGEEKLLIALSMFETARALVLASLDKNLSDVEKRKALFLRFYESDFNKENIEGILKYFNDKEKELS